MITFTQYVYIYLLALPAYFALDMLWIGLVAHSFYKAQIGYLFADSIKWPVAVSFYLLFLVGLMIFVIGPALEVREPLRALAFGALFGFFAYIAYDLTNWATIKDWPALVTFVDILWGTVLSATISYSAYILAVNFILK